MEDENNKTPKKTSSQAPSPNNDTRRTTRSLATRNSQTTATTTTTIATNETIVISSDDESDGGRKKSWVSRKTKSLPDTTASKRKKVEWSTIEEGKWIVGQPNVRGVVITPTNQFLLGRFWDDNHLLAIPIWGLLPELVKRMNAFPPAVGDVPIIVATINEPIAAPSRGAMKNIYFLELDIPDPEMKCALSKDQGKQLSQVTSQAKIEAILHSMWNHLITMNVLNIISHLDHVLYVEEINKLVVFPLWKKHLNGTFIPQDVRKGWGPVLLAFMVKWEREIKVGLNTIAKFIHGRPDLVEYLNNVEVLSKLIDKHLQSWARKKDIKLEQ